MIVKRIDTQKRHPPLRPDGSKQCVWCAGNIPKGRSRWCSQACVDDYEVRGNPGRTRKRVFARDKGVCALCGIDTSRVRDWLRSIPVLHNGSQWVYGRIDRHTEATSFGRVLGRHRARALVLLGRRWGKVLNGRVTFYDMDHIVPLSEGGQQTMANLRILCLGCHQKETSALAGRLAKRPSKGVGR